jgi:hypothetical protein
MIPPRSNRRTFSKYVVSLKHINVIDSGECVALHHATKRLS